MKKALLVLSVFLIILWFVGFNIFCYHIHNYQQETTTHTDALIVLTGGRHRITTAAKLYNRNLADKMFISGVNKTVSLHEIEERNNIEFYNKNQVYLGRQARNTIGNAQESIAWIMANNIRSIRLVTSNYHIPRSLLEFKTLLPDLQIIVYPVYSEKVLKKWWKSWRTFVLISTEYNKYLYAFVRNKFSLS